MSVEVHCPNCGAAGRVDARLCGRRVRCPKCNGWVDVPNDPEPVAEHVVASDDDVVADAIPVELEAEPVDAELVDAEPLEAEPIDVAAVEPEPIAVDASDDFFGEEAGPTEVAIEDAAIEDAELDSADETRAAGSVLAAAAVAAADENASALVTGATLHRVHETTEGHALGLEFADDDEPPKRKKRDDGELDMTPMVDVTFLLLIFFMVTASFSLQKSIQMPRQQSDAPSTSQVEEETEELDSVEVQIDEYGAFLVLGPDWERETPGKQNLISALKDAMGGATDGMRLVIKVQEAAKLQALVDCMDAGAIAGYTETQVTQVEEFD